MYSRAACPENGFSLVELIVAITILAFGVLSTATLLAKGISSNRFAHRVSVESGVASSVLDEIMSRGPGDPVFDSAVVGAVYDLDTSSASTTRTVQGVPYSATYSMAPDTPTPGVATVDVTVTGGGRAVTFRAFRRSL